MVLRPAIRLLVVTLLGAALLIPSSVSAAQATPVGATENPFADLGLPQIDITVTDTAFEGVPAELDAGRYVVALTATTSDPAGGGGTFLRMPEGMTAAAFAELVAPPSATPIAEEATDAASPAAEEGGEGDAPPPWYYETAMAGGPYVASGGTNYAVVDLTAGEWVFWAEFPGAPQAPQPIAVTGDLPADLPTPTADVTIEMSDFAFSFSTPLAAGEQVLEVANVGAQPHFIGIVGVPDGTTVEDLLALVEMEMGGMGGTPEAGAEPAATPVAALSFEDIEDVFGTGDQSAGTTAWYSASLDAGTYAAVCFVTDPETGMPHIMLGMIDVFQVQ